MFKSPLRPLSLALLPLTLLLLCLLLLLTGCFHSQKDTLHIGVLITPMKTFASEMVNHDEAIYCFQDSDPSLEKSELTLEDKQALSELKVYFSLGLPIEQTLIIPYLSANTDVVIYDLAESLQIDSTEHPFFWLAPNLALDLFEQMKHQLSAHYPKMSKKIDVYSEKYQDELSRLDTYIEVKYSAAEDKGVNESQGFLSDYCDRFKLEYPNPNSTPSELDAFIKAHHIGEVFVMDPLLKEELIEETPTEPLHTLAFNPYAEDYLQNLKTLTDTIYGKLLD